MTDPLKRAREALDKLTGASCHAPDECEEDCTNDLRKAIDELEAKLRYWAHHPVENVNKLLREANNRQTERVAAAETRIRELEAQISAQPKALEWRKLNPEQDCGVPMLFRMRVVVGNGVAPQRQSVEYWVDTVRERESEDEDGNIRGVFYDVVDGYGWDIDLVEADAECIPIAAIAPTKGESDG